MDRPLRAFLAVAEERNLTAAAARLGLAQPSLSKLILRLEPHYGAPLFKRLPRGMALTQYGESLYRRAKSIEMEYRFASEEISALKHGHKSVLRVGAARFITWNTSPPPSTPRSTGFRRSGWN